LGIVEHQLSIFLQKLLIGMFNGIATHMDILYLNLLKLVRAIAQAGPVGHNF